MDSVNSEAFGAAFEPLPVRIAVSFANRCHHRWLPHTKRQYWLQCGEGIGPGYAVHAEHHTEHKVTKVYCQHCLEVRDI